jgi:hypothetical protein
VIPAINPKLSPAEVVAAISAIDFHLSKLEFLVRNLLGGLLLGSLILVMGCGPGGASVSGKIVKGGAPYTRTDKESFGLTFMQVDGEKKTFNVAAKSDGTFSGVKVPPGKYRVTLVHNPDIAEFMSKGGGMPKPKVGGGPTGPSGPPDKLNNEFSGDKSPLSIDIAGNCSITIDVGAKSVTKD